MAGDAFRLDGETALITGGGTGLGLAMARRMADAGAAVVITGRREEPLKAAVAAIGPRAFYVVHDVTDLAATPRLVAQAAAAAGGPPSILVNNAGNHLKKPAVDTTEAEFLNVLNTHVMGSFSLTRTLAPGMIRAGKGSILFIASMASVFGIPQVIAYTAAKSAYTGMVRALAVELSPAGVRVNAIAPGWIRSDISDNALNNDPDRKNKILSRTPMHRIGDPDDIAYAAVYLASPAARFVTGTTLVVDGGISVGF
jgi:gluconate 5-dehydrogenase